MYYGDCAEDYHCPGCGADNTGGSLCRDCQNEAAWNASHALCHGPSEDQLRQAEKALDQEGCSSVTLFFSAHETDEEGCLTHINSLVMYPEISSWNFEGTQWCWDFKHPEGGLSPVRGRWNPLAKTGFMDHQIPSQPVAS